MTVRAKKHLGQHFLTNESIAKDISDSLTNIGYDTILEIGPGMGMLTKYLLEKNKKIIVMEIDRDSVVYLKTNFKKEQLNLGLSDDRFNIIEGDFLKYDLSSFFKNKQVAIIGNYPYNISSQIIFKVIEYRAYIPELSGMFQKEVAQRIAEKEGSKTYGIISVLTQAFFNVEYLFTVPPSEFNPPPKVDSGVIRLTRKEVFSLSVDENLFFRVVKTAFNQRRKMLRTSLKSMNLSDTLKEDVIFAMRPEQLSVNEFIKLTHKIAKNVI